MEEREAEDDSDEYSEEVGPDCTYIDDLDNHLT